VRNDGELSVNGTNTFSFEQPTRHNINTKAAIVVNRICFISVTGFFCHQGKASAAPIYHRVFDALSSGNTNEAAQWQARAAKSIEVGTSFGYLPAAKKIMQWIGVDCGPARPPLANPSGQKLDSADFFEWIDECKTA
jgi:dihydrodipicolinate synthase/N-acetylneuraminate lyase